MGDGQFVNIDLEDVQLEGDLAIPDGASGLVVFAHGSGSSRKSPRNNFVAETLRDHGLATLLFDLLTEREDQRYETRFDIDLLADRLVDTTDWVLNQQPAAGLNVGYFGSSTGAAAALRASVRTDQNIHAIVSRGGRVDMADDVLDRITAPTLLIVGGNDDQVLELNRDVYDALNCEKQLEVIDGAGHLFEEPGALEDVATLAADWFSDHL